jgi:glucokinase
MKIILAGDVGGTKTILSLVRIEINQKPLTLHSDRYPSQNYKSLTEIIGQFLEEANQKLEYSFKIETACFGIAGPVANNTSFLTNLKWLLNGEALQSELGIAQVSLINDFAAVGYGILGLESTDLHSIQNGEAIAKAPIALIGAGTGLGMGYLTWNHDRYEVHASEGGHRDFSPRNQIEIALLEFLIQRHDRISIERVISGNGIVSIYQFLRDYHQQKTSTPLANMLIAKEEGASSIDMGAAIAEAAIQKSDPLAIEAIQIFLDAYASEIGNLALEILPNAGLYIAGGIAAKLVSLIASCDDGQARRFLRNIKQKGRVSEILDRYPIQIVLNQNVGLIGTIVYGSQLGE